MSIGTLEGRWRGALERSAVVRLETERVRKRFEEVRQSSLALKADVDRVIAETRAERRRGAAVRHRGSQLTAQCADNLEAVNTLLNVQREIEEDIRRRQVDRAIEHIVEAFAAEGMFAFRWDTTSDLLISLPRNGGRVTSRVQ